MSDITATPRIQQVTVTPTVQRVEIRTGLMGPQGPPGPAGGARYEHVQSAPAATWIIDHNLGVVVGCQLQDTDGRQIYADVVQGTLDQTTVIFPSPQSGVAILQ